MTRQTIIYILMLGLLHSCNNNSTNSTPDTKKTSDQSSEKKQPKQYDLLDHCLNALQENRLDSADSSANELRFYYLSSFDGGYQFYKIKTKDSILIKKVFYCVDPTGGKLDTILSVDTFKLKSSDLNALNKLTKRAMIWSLERKEVSSENILDCSFYIYESIRPKDKYTPDLKTYCLVERYCPSNIDYINLGEFLKSKSKIKNNYKDVNSLIGTYYQAYDVQTLSSRSEKKK